MRRTLQLCAGVKPARYLTPGNPTGLTGLYTHSSPRSSLLYLYSSTLDKLSRFPESSLYRQSVEALTKHRMAIVEAAEPPGYQEWAAKAQKLVQDNPERFLIDAGSKLEAARAARISAGGKVFLRRADPVEKDIREEEWDGERSSGPGAQGLRGEMERIHVLDLLSTSVENAPKVKWEPEPQMTADQVEEVETKIGAGLIEEVVQMAESELKLVDILYQSKVWENLEDPPAEGQWTYFEREAS